MPILRLALASALLLAGCPDGREALECDAEARCGEPIEGAYEVTWRLRSGNCDQMRTNIATFEEPLEWGPSCDLTLNDWNDAETVHQEGVLSQSCGADRLDGIIELSTYNASGTRLCTGVYDVTWQRL